MRLLNPSLIIGIAIGAWIILYKPELSVYFTQFFELADAWLESNFNVTIVEN